MIVNDFISHLVQKSAFFQIFDLNGFNTRGTMYEWRRESTTGVFTVGLADLYDVLVPLDRTTIVM